MKIKTTRLQRIVITGLMTERDVALEFVRHHGYELVNSGFDETNPDDFRIEAIRTLYQWRHVEEITRLPWHKVESEAHHDPQ